MEQIPLDKNARADNPFGDPDDGTREVAIDLAYKKLMIVNVAFYGIKSQPNWVLIDAGLAGTSASLIDAAQERFGEQNPPAAIVMTHAHFDHVGALEKLADMWNVPVYAHPLEFPYLNGEACYPEPDPSVGGGMNSMLSRFFPRGPVNVSKWLQALPEDGTVPHMAGWRWIHTPGHTPGHISLWREADRTVISGDAFITTRQESAYASMLYKAEMHGPPMYFTIDWEAARDSVRELAALKPDVAVTMHGNAMRGPEMTAALQELADRFDEVAVPKEGKYVGNPARPEDGTAYVG